jgi:hypothetical protein
MFIAILYTRGGGNEKSKRRNCHSRYGRNDGIDDCLQCLISTTDTYLGKMGADKLNKKRNISEKIVFTSQTSFGGENENT